jgi:hypothetical protein
MVMGPTHAIQGFGAGLATALVMPATITDLSSTPAMLAFAVITGGAAIAPDLDHPGATASRSLGPVTGGVAWFLHHLSGFVYRHTKTSRDFDRDGTHRGITHTWPGALIGGAMAAAACEFGGLVGTVAVLFLFSLFALRAIPPREAPVVDLVTASVLAGLGWWLLPTDGFTAWVGVAVVIGMIVHCLGDALTVSGVPLLWPFTVSGQRWYPVRTPYLVRFRAAGPGDRVVRFLSVLGVLALVIALFPGGWPWIVDTVGAVVTAWRSG